MKGRHGTQHNDILHNDAQHKRLTCDTQHKWHSAKTTLSIITLYYYAEFCILLIITLNVIMLSVLMLSVIMLSVIMLNVVKLNVEMLNVVKLSVIMLSVVAHNESDWLYKRHPKFGKNAFENIAFEQKAWRQTLVLQFLKNYPRHLSHDLSYKTFTSVTFPSPS
jgi:hypothetical protein